MKDKETAIDIARHPSGRGYRLSSEVHLPRPLESVFEFFADAFKLQDITPPWMHFRVVSPPPIEMKQGVEIDYRLRVHGIPIRWRSRISVWEPPYRFIDEQVIGPYRWWRHEHIFEDYQQGTRMRDLVDYGAPLGWLAQALMVRRDLRRIFEYRANEIQRAFSPPP